MSAGKVYWPRWALRAGADGQLTPLARHILLALSVYFNESGSAYPSYRELAAVTGRSRSQVARALREIRGAGVVESSGSRGTGGSALFTASLECHRRHSSAADALESHPQDAMESDPRHSMEAHPRHPMEYRPQDAMESHRRHTEVPPEVPEEVPPEVLNDEGERERARATIGPLEESTARVVEILQTAPRLTIRQHSIEAALATSPAVDPVSAAQLTVARAADPGWRTTDAGAALALALTSIADARRNGGGNGGGPRRSTAADFLALKGQPENGPEAAS